VKLFFLQSQYGRNSLDFKTSNKMKELLFFDWSFEKKHLVCGDLQFLREDVSTSTIV